MSCHRHAVGLTRRELIQVGYSGLLGIGMTSLGARTSRASGPSTPRARSVVLIFLTGAPSQIDTFDPKPEALKKWRSDRFPGEDSDPAVVRVWGEHTPLDELLPSLAPLAERLWLPLLRSERGPV